ncbi:hypothetical protein ALC53_06982, partial [Atta colombica]
REETKERSKQGDRASLEPSVHSNTLSSPPQVPSWNIPPHVHPRFFFLRFPLPSHRNCSRYQRRSVLTLLQRSPPSHTCLPFLTSSTIIDDIIHSSSEYAAFRSTILLLLLFSDDHPRCRRDDFFRIPFLHPSSHHPDEHVGGSGGDVYRYDVIADIVASRGARHPVAGARVACCRGYHGCVVITVGVDVGGRRTLRRLLMTRQPLLLLLAEHLVGKVLNQCESLPSLMAHQAHVVLKLGALLSYVREINEESRTHISFERLDVIRLRRFVNRDNKGLRMLMFSQNLRDVVQCHTLTHTRLKVGKGEKKKVSNISPARISDECIIERALRRVSMSWCIKCMGTWRENATRLRPGVRCTRASQLTRI